MEEDKNKSIETLDGTEPVVVLTIHNHKVNKDVPKLNRRQRRHGFSNDEIGDWWRWDI